MIKLLGKNLWHVFTIRREETVLAMSSPLLKQSDSTALSKSESGSPTTKTKLPAIPQSQAGERPYYAEMYYKYGKMSQETNEYVQVQKRLIWSCNVVYKLDNYKSHWFQQNEWMQKTLQVPLSHEQRPETWDARNDATKALQKLALPYCEEAVKATHKFFKNRAPIPSMLVPVENTSTFIANDVGLLIHVWTSHLEAKKFMHGYRNYLVKIQELHLDNIFIPHSVMVEIWTITVTATTLVPLTTEKPIPLLHAPIVAHLVDQLEVYCRSKKPIQLHLGADGRYYCMDSNPILHTHNETNGERSPLVRMVLFESFPSTNTTPEALEECMIRNIDTAMDDLINQITAKGEDASGVMNLKIQELVMERIVPRVLHEHGVKVSTMYQLLYHRKCQDEGVGAVVKETLTAEMVCRTLKELVRAEIAMLQFVPAPTAPITAAFSFLIEILNRAIYNLLVRPELWDTHFLDVLRQKFRTPDSFVIPQTAVTKRLLLSYLTVNLGPLFEGGKFTRCGPVNVMHTMMKPCPVTQLVIGAKRNDAHQLLLSHWKRIADIRSVSLQVCAMVHQVCLFATARSPSLDWYIALLQRKIEELNDPVVSAVTDAIIVECLGELPEIVKFRKAMAEYQKAHLPDIGKEDAQDLPIATDRYRKCAVTLALMEKGHERQTTGKLNATGTERLLSITEHDPTVLTDVNVTMLSNALNYLYNIPDQHEACRQIFLILKAACTTKERTEKIAASLQKFTGDTLTLDYEPSQEAIDVFRDISCENLSLHQRFYGDEDFRYHIAVLLSACHWGRFFGKTGDLEEKEVKDMDKFTKASLKVHSTLISEQKELMRSEWYVAMSGPAAQCMMDHGQWGTAQHMIGFTQKVFVNANFKSSAKKVEGTRAGLISPNAALPQLESSTRSMVVGIKAAEKLQRDFRDRRRREAEARARAKEEAERMDRLRAERLKTCNTPIAPNSVLGMCRELLVLHNKVNDVKTIPRLHAVQARRRYCHFYGLRTLLCVTKIKKCVNLCYAMMHSGIFPPLRWDLRPGGSGFRNIAITPDTTCIGSWFSPQWLQIADFDASKCLLFAKVAANFIYSQYKYTFLQWRIAGFGFCGCVAQALAALLPADQIVCLVTVGSPPCLRDTSGFHAVPHAHVTHESDLLPKILGYELKGYRSKLFSRIEGIGAILPFPVSGHDLNRCSKLVYYGIHRHEVTGDPQFASSKVVYQDWEQSHCHFDFRNCMCYPLEYYYALLQKCIGKQIVLPSRWIPPDTPILHKGIDPWGNPTDALMQAYDVPPTVEPIACKRELLLLAYPKIAQSLAEGHGIIPDDYGMEVLPHVEVIESIEGCTNVDLLSELLASFVGSSWNAEWIAQQLFEWSGAGDRVKNKDTSKSYMNRRSSVYGVELSSGLVEQFVERHSFYFNMSPYSAVGGGGRREIATPLYFDGVDEVTRRMMAQTDGYHLGWTVCVASTARQVGKTSLIEALTAQVIDDENFSVGHRRSIKTTTIPTIRMKWTPKKDVNGSDHPLFLQVMFQEVRWDGKMAANTLLRSASQIVWVVIDHYTFDQLMKIGDFTKDAFYIIVYLPRETPEPEIVQRVKNFALKNSYPFAIVDQTRQESVENLQRMLIHWMLPSFHFPLNPSLMPINVDFGTLYAHDEATVNQYVKRVTAPTFGNLDTSGLADEDPLKLFKSIPVSESVVINKRHEYVILAAKAAQMQPPPPKAEVLSLKKPEGKKDTSQTPPPENKDDPRSDAPRARSNSPPKPPGKVKQGGKVISIRAAAQAARKEVEEEERVEREKKEEKKEEANADPKAAKVQAIREEQKKRLAEKEAILKQKQLRLQKQKEQRANQVLQAGLRKEVDVLMKRALHRYNKGADQKTEEENSGYSAEELQMLKRHFQYIDTSGDEQVDKGEFVDFYVNVVKSGLNVQEISQIFDQLDADKGGTLSQEEFVKCYAAVSLHEVAKRESKRADNLQTMQLKGKPK